MRKLGELKDQVRINGFRPGKVPVAHLKRLYGRAVMAEMIEAAVREANAQIVTERGFKLVREPQVTLPEEQGAVEQVIEGKSDLAYTVAIEILPTIELARFQGHPARAAHRRGDRRRGRRGARRRSPSRTGRSPPRARAPRPRTATASPSTSPARSTATPFEGGTGGDVAVHHRLRHLHPGLRGSARSASRRASSAPST